MLNLDSIQQMQQFTALLIAYVPTVTISGFIEAWVITLTGDDTAEDLGFLTLNPMRHIDYIGILFLFLISWGFGQRIPYDPSGISSPFKKLKLIAIVFTRPVVHFILMILSVLVSVLFKNGDNPFVLMDISAFSMALNLIVAGFLSLNFTFFVIYSILGLATILVEFLLPDAYSRSLSVNVIVSVVFPMILFIALHRYIQYGLLVLLRSVSNLF